MVPTLEHLLVRLVEDFEENFYQVWSVKVVEVLFAEIRFVSSLHASQNNGLICFDSMLDQAAISLVRDSLNLVKLKLGNYALRIIFETSALHQINHSRILWILSRLLWAD